MEKRFGRKYPDNARDDEKIKGKLPDEHEENATKERVRELNRIIRASEETMKCVYAGPEYFERKLKTGEDTEKT